MTPFASIAPFYDALYAELDTAGDIQFMLRRFAQYAMPVGTMLDLGCGTGRHVLELHRQGVVAHGVDVSQAMLQQAAANAQAERLPGALPEFSHGDVRSVRLGRQFDAVASLFHVASYMQNHDDLIGLLETARAHLPVGGGFLFDVWHGPAVRMTAAAPRIKRVQQGARRFLRLSESSVEPHAGLVHVDFTLLVLDDATRNFEEHTERHSMRPWFPDEVAALLTQT